MFLFLAIFATFALFNPSVGEIAYGQLCGEKGNYQYYNGNRLWYLQSDYYRYQSQEAGRAIHLDACMKLCNDNTICRSFSFYTYTYSWMTYYYHYCELWDVPTQVYLFKCSGV